MKKILVIINKNWETEPVLNALTNPKLRPAALPFPEVINTPCDGDNRMSQPRAVFSLPREGEEPLQVVVRCIEDLMATGVNTSSSLEKYKVLPQAIAADAADLIISVSTANYPDPAVTHNGTVVLGGNFFIHDGNPENHADPEHNLIDDRVGTFIASNVAPACSVWPKPSTPACTVTPAAHANLSRRPTSPHRNSCVKERPPSRQ